LLASCGSLTSHIHVRGKLRWGSNDADAGQVRKLSLENHSGSAARCEAVFRGARACIRKIDAGECRGEIGTGRRATWQ
jgi:hypothetical protein